MDKTTYVFFKKFENLANAINVCVDDSHWDVAKVTVHALAIAMQLSARESKMDVPLEKIYGVISSAALDLANGREVVKLILDDDDKKLLDGISDKELEDIND